MADDKAAEPADNGRESEKAAEPKKEFGILAARFLQKGKSSPASATGEFEALKSPEQKASDAASEPASGEEKRPKAPILADVNEDEQGESFMVSAAALDLGESLYSYGAEEVYDLDTGLGEPTEETVLPTAEENVVEIDLDTVDEPSSETTYEIAEPEQQVEESQPEPQYEIPEPAQEVVEIAEEQVAEPEYEAAQPQYEVPEPEDQPAEPQYEVPEPEYLAPEPAEAEAVPEATAEPEYQETVAAQAEYELPPADLEAATEPTYEAEEYSPAAEASEVTEPEPPAPPSFDKSVLDSIGIKTGDSPILSAEALDQIGTKSEPPAKSGLLGKFASKKDSLREESRLIDLNALKAKKPDGEQSYDISALNQIGVKKDPPAESPSFDASMLDQIGASSLDQIRAPKDPAYDASSLDEIGFKKDSPPPAYDANILDQIGVRADSTSTPYDPGVLDEIGIKKTDSPPLDNRIFVDPSEVQEDEKPAKGGLLGGKFGQKAKSFGGEKPKLGSIQNDPNVDQKETGRFMIDVPLVPRDTHEIMPEPLTALSPALGPEEEAAAPVEDIPEPPPSIPGDEIGRWITDADSAFKLRQFRQAEPIYARALDKLDKVGVDNDPRLVYLLDRSGDNLNELKKHKEALPIFRRLLILHEKVSSQDRDIISTLYKIARTSEMLGLTAEADSMYKRAFRLGQQSLVPGDPLLAKVLEGYGTMLMRSEGSEPPTSEKPQAAPKSTLSPDEIKMLNELNLKAEAEAGSGSAIALGGGGEGSVGSLPQRESKPKAALRETDERVEKMRAKGEGRPPSSTAMAVRVAIFLIGVFFFANFINSMSIDYSRPKPFVFVSGPYNGFVYHTIEGAALITFFDNQHGTRSYFGSQTHYDYAPWNGKPGDDWEVLSGKIGAENFAYVIPEGLKDTKGVIYYEAKAPENIVVSNMRELGVAAQNYYKAHKKYPDGNDLTKLTKIDYTNPFKGDNNITARSIAWPTGLDAKQLFIKSTFDKGLEEGNTWESEPGGNGVITAISSQNKKPAASVFYVHGRDRHGNLLRRVDGKVFFLSFKNGLELTPGAAIDGEPKPPKKAVPLRVTALGTVNVFTVLLGYVPLVATFIAFVVFLGLYIRRRILHTQGPSVVQFGSIWAAVMMALCLAPKLAPDPYDNYAIPAALLVFGAGLSWIIYSIKKYLPKTPKKAKAPKAAKRPKPKKGPKPTAQPMETAAEKPADIPAPAEIPAPPETESETAPAEDTDS